MQSARSVTLGFTAIALAILAACGTDDSRSSQIDRLDQEPVSTPLPVPVNEYINIVWLDEHTFVFLYDSLPDDIQPNKLGIFDLTVGELTEVAISDYPEQAPADCRPVNTSNLRRVSANKFSFIRDCSREQDHRIFWRNTLFHYEITTQSTTAIQTFPYSNNIFAWGPIPDDGRLIAEQGAPPVKSALFLVTPDASKPIDDLDLEAQPLLERYRAVRRPDVSIDGRVAVVGSGVGGDRFQDSAGSLLTESVDIVVLNIETLEDEIVFKGLNAPGHVAWSPDGKRIAFAGELDGDTGIWILDVETRNVRQVWNEVEFFDWSPDGRQMVVLHDADGRGGLADPSNLNSPLPPLPVIIDVTG